MRTLSILCLLLFAALKAAAFTSHTHPGVAKRSLTPIRTKRKATTRDENNQAEAIAQSQQGEWRDATIVSSRPACPSGKSTFIQLQVDAKTQSEYTIPGQFLQFRYQDEEPIFLAIASAPKNPTFDFLIKMAPRLSWLPEALKEGNTVQVSPVLGRGFSFKDWNVDKIILAAAGSGIAPLKACIESGILPSSADNKLYYGEWSKDELCFTELYDNWKLDLGMEVIPVLSRTKDSRGYVQNVLQQEEKAISSPDSTGVILCGMDDMVESSTKVLLEAGIPKQNILLNL